MVKSVVSVFPLCVCVSLCQIMSNMQMTRFALELFHRFQILELSNSESRTPHQQSVWSLLVHTIVEHCVKKLAYSA